MRVDLRLQRAQLGVAQRRLNGGFFVGLLEQPGLDQVGHADLDDVVGREHEHLHGGVESVARDRGYLLNRVEQCLARQPQGHIACDDILDEPLAILGQHHLAAQNAAEVLPLDRDRRGHVHQPAHADIRLGFAGGVGRQPAARVALLAARQADLGRADHLAERLKIAVACHRPAVAIDRNSRNAHGLGERILDALKHLNVDDIFYSQMRGGRLGDIHTMRSFHIIQPAGLRGARSSAPLTSQPHSCREPLLFQQQRE